MLKLFASTLVAALALTGCTTLSDAWTQPPGYLAQFQDAPVSAAIATLGQPTNRHGRIHEWAVTPSQSTNLACRIYLGADAAGRIVSTRAQGSTAHCESFVAQLKAGARPMADAKRT
jgi:hypothetical protein